LHESLFFVLYPKTNTPTYLRRVIELWVRVDETDGVGTFKEKVCQTKEI